MFQPRNIVSANTETHSYFPAFDFLRASAALGVFLSHSEFRDLLPEEIGNACVQVFFALSGFLIGGILLKAKPGDLPRFYFNRSTRIWIPYWVAFAIVLVVTALKQGLGDAKFFEFFFYQLTFVYNWFGPYQIAQGLIHRMPLDGASNHFWSICVEEQFYLFAPFALIFLPRLLTAAGLAIAVALNFLEPHYFASVSLGVALALLEHRRFHAGVVCAIAASGLSIFLPYASWMPFVATAIVAAASWRGEQCLIGRVVGGASYPFYLNSWVGIFVGSALERKYGVPVAAGFAMEIAIAGSVALGHYFLIDSTIARYRGQFFSPAIGTFCCAAGIGLVTIGMVGGIILTTRH